MLAQDETVGRSQTRDVAREYGRTQGPAGESIPEDPTNSENRSAAEDVSNYSLGIVGPSDRLLVDGDVEGADAALYAADRAQKQGRSEDAVLDALEAAETQYNASHQPDPGKGLFSRMEGTLNGSSVAPGSPRSPRGIARTGSGVKGALHIDDATRQKVRERIAAGLRKNPNLSEGSQDIESIAAACEETCFLSCSTRTVFFSKAGNAARLAASLPAADLAELPRIASGQAKQVSFTYLLGNALWFVATSFQIVEALNPGYDLKVVEWEAGGRMGPKPRYIWFGLRLTNLAWWGACSYTLGVALYLGAAIATIINDCPNTLLAPNVYLWLVDYFYLIAGVLFALSGIAYVMYEISMWLIPGIFCPFTRKHATSLQWWALWFYFWGGIGFAMGGIQLYWYSPINLVETVDQYNIITGVGFGGGSICFFLGATLLLARQSRGRCKPSYGITASRLDPTIHTGSHYMDGTSAANKV
ncbi:hypothetical protein COCSUDRAFT_60164 [Coccomyxa subellipsoidea C-169]|uniref:Uncharacterized protein n=1 Tax=Coccomyxa subellipsoidea (strain C-169) TaxID=574566 RepID=I0YJC8_COCSC|nr:hypothetical protein COCSUDRAFT_60164 [Coccomyxa subellipsoidea C-169]EIE18497.1 hypothetical protein COCSUDRAFT_60164 [Coccomyxa subellipsoidea C-169]|eukprot:XP_005643041.1 hypothetical protein COCSUDRAFT_60164 [Coccomyxa subellipsoidea C-169]